MFCPEFYSMIHPKTLEAVESLAQAFIDHPEDLKKLKIYGDIPAHVLDILSDFGSKK